MKTIKLILLMLVPLLAAPTFSFAQYFQNLFDNDSTYDWGWCILNRPDNNYFVLGWSENDSTGHISTFSMIISNDGNRMISKKHINISYNLQPGYEGEINQLSNGYYIIPINCQIPNSTYLTSAAGFAKLGSLGDTIFLKTYTDTSIYFDIIYASAIMPDGGYIGGGKRLKYSF